MKNVSLSDVPEHSPSKRTLRLPLSSVLAICVCVVAAMALAYLYGVMQGRDSASSQRQNSIVVEGRKQEESEAAKGGVLPPEELGYVQALRDEAGGRGRRPVPAAPGQTPPGPQTTPGADAAPGSNPAAGTAPGTAPGTRAAPPGAAPEAPVITTTEKGRVQGKMYDFVFQVAAYKDEGSGDGLRQRLEGRGFRTQMKREGKMYVVYILMRGDEARAEEVAQTTEALHLGKPILRGRKLVKQQ
ncbi:MAG: SPOR domain-containing protein [Desulfovibrio sp.]|jgi:cell division septation protein DedD|nr:SPOR domain-containing protein [Desulfovibrio sp.]